MVMTRRKFIVGASALAGTAAAACGGAVTPAVGPKPSAVAAAPTLNWASVEQEAMREKTVTWYTASQNVADAIAKGFKAAYPWAEVQALVGTNTDRVSRLLTELKTNAPTADVMYLGPTLRSTLLAQKAISPVLGLPSEAKLPKTSLDPEGYKHPIYLYPVLFSYNTKLVKSPPTDYMHLADPIWKGKILLDRPANQIGAATFLAAKRMTLGEAKWQSFLDGVKANNPTLFPDAKSTLDGIVRGEGSICLGGWPQTRNATDTGAPVDSSWYQDAVPFEQNLYMTSKAPHPNMAKLFMDWQMSEQGQRTYSSINFCPILDTLDVPNALKRIVPAGIRIMALSELNDYYERTDDYMAEFNRRWPS